MSRAVEWFILEKVAHAFSGLAALHDGAPLRTGKKQSAK